jgi:protein SCO1/2
MSALRIAAVLAMLACATPAAAYVTPQAAAAQAGFTQRLGDEIPGGLAFRDDAGRAVRLADYFDGDTPVVLVFAWFGCTTLCPTVVAHLAAALAKSGDGTLRYRVLVASIDPRDAAADAARMKRQALALSPSREGDWHFLTGRPDALARLAGAAGFRYAYDADTHQYAHPAGFLLLTPQGTIARYVLGFAFTPAALRSGLQDARAAIVASPVDRLLLLCFHFTPAGRYGATAMAALRIASLALLATALGVALRWRRARSAR